MHMGKGRDAIPAWIVWRLWVYHPLHLVSVPDTTSAHPCSGERVSIRIPSSKVPMVILKWCFFDFLPASSGVGAGAGMTPERKARPTIRAFFMEKSMVAGVCLKIGGRLIRRAAAIDGSRLGIQTDGDGAEVWGRGSEEDSQRPFNISRWHIRCMESLGSETKTSELGPLRRR